MKAFLYIQRAWCSVAIPLFWFWTITESGYGVIWESVLLLAMSANFAWWWSERREMEADL